LPVNNLSVEARRDVSVIRKYISDRIIVRDVDRRTYLSGLDAGALAGCLGAGSEPTLSGPSEPIRLEIESTETRDLSLRVNDLGEDSPLGTTRSSILSSWTGRTTNRSGRRPRSVDSTAWTSHPPDWSRRSRASSSSRSTTPTTGSG